MTDCLLIPLNFVKINNYATVEERKKERKKRKKKKEEKKKRRRLQTIFPFSHPPLSPHSNSLSLVFI